MKLSIPFLAVLSLVRAWDPDIDDGTITVTVTRTFTTCPWTTVNLCETTKGWEEENGGTHTSAGTATSSAGTSNLGSLNTSSSSSTSSSARPPTTSSGISTSTFSDTTTTSTDSETTSTSTNLSSTSSLTSISTSATLIATTSSQTSLSSTTSSTTSQVTTTTTSSGASTTSTASTTLLQTTTSTAAGTVTSPGVAFIPSAQLPGTRLTKRSTVYIDLSNPNAAYLTTDSTKATAFEIDATGVLSATLNSYYSICGGSEFMQIPGRFTCSNSGSIPQTFRGWTNNPTMSYKDWKFCYKSDLSLYMFQKAVVNDCTTITFAPDFSGAAAGNS